MPHSDDANTGQNISVDANIQELREWILLALWRCRGALVVLAQAPEPAACKHAGNEAAWRVALMAQESASLVDTATSILAEALLPAPAEE